MLNFNLQKIKHSFVYNLKAFGFKDEQDLLESTFHYKSSFNIMAIGSLLSLLATFIESFVGLEPIVYLSFILLLVLEFWTGTKASLKAGKKIESRKWGRMIVKIGIYTTILGIVNIFSFLPTPSIGDFEVEIYKWVYYTVLNMIVIQLLISVFENLAKLGFKESSGIFKVLSNKLEKWFDLEKDND